MDNLFAERPLYGWPGTFVRLYVYDHGKNFTTSIVQPLNEETPGTVLYDGPSFEDAGNAYLHPFVTNFETVHAIVSA